MASMTWKVFGWLACATTVVVLIMSTRIDDVDRSVSETQLPTTSVTQLHNKTNPMSDELLVRFKSVPVPSKTQELSARTVSAKHRTSPPRIPTASLTRVGVAEGVIVTAASDSHLCALLQLLMSLNHSAPTTSVVVYDLNVEEPFIQIDDLRKVHANVVSLRRFEYSKFPPWFRVDNGEAGSWAWKPVIIKEVVDEYQTALWLDSGAVMMKGRNISSLFERITRTGFYSAVSRGSIFMFVHVGLFAHFGFAKCCNEFDLSKLKRGCCCCGEEQSKYARCIQCDEELVPADMEFWRSVTMCNGAIIGFHRDDDRAYTKLLIPWVKCATNKQCIAPVYGSDTSTRTNHRQDQAALTFLSAQLGYKCESGSVSVGVALHKDEPNARVEGWLDELVQGGLTCTQIVGNRSRLKHQHI
eukprot:m.154606 g.154606  ORF g.154606 m.154606 type:complete len:413 (-) comp30897_c0_seq1:270-1508(-)